MRMQAVGRNYQHVFANAHFMSSYLVMSPFLKVTVPRSTHPPTGGCSWEELLGGPPFVTSSMFLLIATLPCQILMLAFESNPPFLSLADAHERPPRPRPLPHLDGVDSTSWSRLSWGAGCLDPCFCYSVVPGGARWLRTCPKKEGTAFMIWDKVDH